MSNWFYVGMAYGLTYAALIGYALYLGRKCREAERLSKEEVRP
jgi:hypothetical protein